MLVSLLALPLGLFAQGNILTAVAPPRVTAQKNSVVTVKVAVQLRNGYHVNSNSPEDDYLIPLKLSWTSDPLLTEAVVYPAPKKEKYAFSQKPLSVFTGDFEIATRFKVPPAATPGLRVITAKLRYQACTHQECFPPKTVEVKLPVDIVN
ncbi:MAG: hypothetical protein HYZ37_01850 [Candidatus Solibacter usitatus]|nr:hypothetical protein [Candidatus Solibacter usitatus]